MEVFGQWHSHYTRAANIDTGLGKSGEFSKQATDDAEQYGWRFEQLKGDPELVRNCWRESGTTISWCSARPANRCHP